LKWSLQAQVYSLTPVLERFAYDPAAVNVPVGLPSQRAIDCVLDYSLVSSFDRSQDITGSRFHVRNQMYSCRLFGASSSLSALPNWRQDFFYDDICHTLAFDSFIANHPFLIGHVPVASMPTTWNPRVAPETDRPMHDPVIDAERQFPTVDPDAALSSPD
jgi:hypothetical protein